MCGIFGVYQDSGLTELDRSIFESLFEIQKHRGPDSSGRHVDVDLAIGASRLTIVDQLGGKQPMFDTNSQYVLVANCEIYNYLELRESLSNLGYEFKTESDTEVILAAYSHFGVGFASHFQGMFAIALLDKTSKKLVLARDRLGEKPLYIAHTASGFLFASEIRSIIKSGYVPFILNQDCLEGYLNNGYMMNGVNVIENIKTLMPGCIETFSLETRVWHREKYWDPRNLDIGNLPIGQNQKSSLIINTISQISKADVPTGLSLSGGIDSYLIASIASKRMIKPKALIVGYGGDGRFDETKPAVQAAVELGLDYFCIDMQKESIGHLYREICLLRDLPVSDIAGPCYFQISKTANKLGLKVVLNGIGSDELFWGYPWMREATVYLLRRKATIEGSFELFDYVKFRPPPNGRSQKLLWFLTFFGFLSNLKFMVQDLAARFTRDIRIDFSEFQYGNSKRKKIINSFLGKQNMQKNLEQMNLNSTENLDLEAIIYQMEGYLLMNGLSQIDTLGMANSVEARTPFVDIRIVELAIHNSREENNHRLGEKDFLKKHLRDFIPTRFLNQKKVGFTPPVKEWYLKIFEQNKEYLENPRLVALNLFKPSIINYLRSPLDSLGRPKLMWLELVTLELWIRGMEGLEP
jgi:asparagine synthase (glutamine-hydrolysing)